VLSAERVVQTRIDELLRNQHYQISGQRTKIRGKRASREESDGRKTASDEKQQM
jgi:hypothetical protein